jgi:UDP-glucose 4-epimerase
MTAGPRILVTGASGFIGQHIVRELAANGYRVRAAARQPIMFKEPHIEGVALGDMSRSFAAEYLVRGVDAVIHAAGLAHARDDLPDDAYTAINVEATRKLAQAARAARVKRFVLMSSIRAQVGASHAGVITETTPTAPTDAYGRSKAAAEALTAETLESSRTNWTVLRPVLVYGPNVKGNMAALMHLASLPLPLPFGAAKSRRSLVSIGNLAAAVRHVLSSETSGNGSFVVADDAPVTMAEMIRAVRQGLGTRTWLLPVPEAAVAAALRLAGRADLVDRLTGELVVDASRLRSSGWVPRETTPTGLAAAARAGWRNGRH